MSKKLSVGEWRLFLLSDCIKYQPELFKHTSKLRSEGKGAVLQITQNDATELDNFVSDLDVDMIRRSLLKEWHFTGKVVDNGKGVKTTCEYCQYQQIRYKYLCVNKINKTWLELGSTCVGNVVYGEQKMSDKDFAKDLVTKLDTFKSKDNITKQQDNVGRESARREEQKDTIRVCVQYLRAKGHGNNSFLKSLEQRWHSGKSLTDKQMDALVRFCKEERDKMKGAV